MATLATVKIYPMKSVSKNTKSDKIVKLRKWNYPKWPGLQSGKNLV